MTEESQMDIRNILDDLQQGPMLSTHRGKIEALMRHFSANEIPLATCADPRHMRRSISTLKAYARDFKLKFPDYVPTSLRPPKPPKVRKPRTRKAKAA